MSETDLVTAEMESEDGGVPLQGVLPNDIEIPTEGSPASSTDSPHDSDQSFQQSMHDLDAYLVPPTAANSHALDDPVYDGDVSTEPLPGIWSGQTTGNGSMTAQGNEGHQQAAELEASGSELPTSATPLDTAPTDVLMNEIVEEPESDIEAGELINQVMDGNWNPMPLSLAIFGEGGPAAHPLMSPSYLAGPPSHYMLPPELHEGKLQIIKNVILNYELTYAQGIGPSSNFLKSGGNTLLNANQTSHQSVSLRHPYTN